MSSLSTTTVAVNVVVTLGMLVLIPLGLRLLTGPGLALAARWWPLPAVLGAACLWSPRGAAVTIGLAVVYAVATGVLVGIAAVRGLAALQRGRIDPREVAAVTALVCPSVAGVALVAERSGHELFGFDLEILALTVPHLHFAGFAAALVAGLVSRTDPSSRLGTVAALSVPGGTALVLAGYFVDDWVELAGAAVLTVGMWAVGWVSVTRLRGRGAGRFTDVLLLLSSGVLAVTMLLALWWAVGEATGVPHPTIGWMVATHGIANAVGFGLCGVLAWRRLAVGRL